MHDTKTCSDNQINSKIDLWERKLLDFSLRNTLLNLSLKRRAVLLRTVGADIIEDHLQDGEEFAIATDDGSMADVKKDMEQHRLHAYSDDNGKTIENTLKNIYRAVRSATEETGANPLYLAIGTLKWYESNSSTKERYAPLMLLPMEMVFRHGVYYIRTRDEEMVLNVTLTEFLKQTFDINVPLTGDLPKDQHGIDVKRVLEIFREATHEQARWDVEAECILGIFSFSKFLMWKDMHAHRHALTENKIVRSIVEQCLTWQPEPLTTSMREMDSVLAPNDMTLPMAADSSQMAAVYEAALGHSFILYGPPGTGKSQTITNLIANAMYNGKRVLFVAEKMAALSVVHERLKKIYLEPFCLELHSNKTTKKHILDQLAMALDVTLTGSPGNYNHTSDTLYKERMHLVDYMQAMHEVSGNDGLSIYECIERYEAITDALPFKGSVLTKGLVDYFHKNKTEELTFTLGKKLLSVISITGTPSEHPLRDLDLTEADLMADAKIWTSMAEDCKAFEKVIDEYNYLITAPALKAKIPSTIKQDADADNLRDTWEEIKDMWFLPRHFAKKRFLEMIFPDESNVSDAEVDAVFDSLTEYKKLQKRILEVQRMVAQHTGRLYATDVMPDIEEIKTLINKLTTWTANRGSARTWIMWCSLRRELIGMGLEAVVECVENGSASIESICPSFMKALYMSLAEDKISRSPVLCTFEGSIFEETVERYKQLSAQFRLMSQEHLYAFLASRIREVTEGVENSREIALLRRNISNGGRGMSMRTLMDQLPTLLPRLCPCMLMSPMSVSQYLPLVHDMFDLVIFDEASQMPTSEAIGAIARGKSLIVVGDPKQMPPTSFFNTTNTNDDEADIEDMESILEDCRTLEMPSLGLSWHYRSRHESLIAFSNKEYYDDSLITFPSTDDRTTKVSYVNIAGHYTKGTSRHNKAEAEAIVEEVVTRLTDPQLSRQSIGIITFNISQQNLIEDLLYERIESNPHLSHKAASMSEPIFVKNLENVQGDERDVILFSVGYGADADGHLSINFGPLNRMGGERRLNVAVSRARCEMKVFSTLKPEDIDLSRTNAKGVEGLKHFLQYAQTGTITSTSTPPHQYASPIAAAIARSLEAHGYKADTGIGRSQFKIDIAVASPNNPSAYTLAILLDGEGYYSTPTTCDREIVQPSVLESLGWHVMRVRAIDWLTHPAAVTELIIEKLTEAQTEGYIKEAEADAKEADTAEADVQPIIQQEPEPLTITHETNNTTNNNSMKYDVFISYRRDKGSNKANGLAKSLREIGYEVFLDKEEIHQDDYIEKITNAIKESTDVILLLTEGYMDRCVAPRDVVAYEIKTAAANNKNIILLNYNGEFKYEAWPQGLPDYINKLKTRNALDFQTFPGYKGPIKKLTKQYMKSKPHLLTWEEYKKSPKGKACIEGFERLQDPDISREEFKSILDSINQKYCINCSEEEKWDFGEMYDFFEGQTLSDYEIEDWEDVETCVEDSLVHFYGDDLDLAEYQMACESEEAGKEGEIDKFFKQFLKNNYNCVPWLSFFFYKERPDIFIPLFGETYRLRDILEAEGIEYPHQPERYDYIERTLFYTDLCAAVLELKVKLEETLNISITDAEMCAYLYDYKFAPLQIENPEDLPARNAWFIGGINSPLEKGANYKVWQTNLEAKKGDILVFYEGSPVSAITSIWRAQVDAFVEFTHYHCFTCAATPIMLNENGTDARITQKELKADSYFKDHKLVRKNMQGVSGLPMSKEDYERLLEMLAAKGFDISKLPTLSEEEENTSYDEEEDNNITQTYLDITTPPLYQGDDKVVIQGAIHNGVFTEGDEVIFSSNDDHMRCTISGVYDEKLNPLKKNPKEGRTISLVINTDEIGMVDLHEFSKVIKV